MSLPPRRRLLSETARGVIPESIRNLEQDAETFQRLLDESRTKRLPRSNEELIAEVERAMPDAHNYPQEEDQMTVPDQTEQLKELDKVIAPEPPPPTPAEIIGTSVATIEQCAITMAEEGRRAARAVDLISQMIKADSELFASEALKLNSTYCSRVADYLKECQDIQMSFQQQKDAMIKRVQALGPIIKPEGGMT